MKSSIVTIIKTAIISLSVGVFLSEPATSAKAQERIVHFPKDRTLGTVYIHDKNLELWEEGKELCEARGNVSFPADKELWLRMTHGTYKNISDLASLGAEDIQHLYIRSNNIKTSDISYIKGLTGLKSLTLNGDNLFPSPMTGEALLYLKDLNSLRRLSIWFTQIDDHSFEHLKHLKSLEELQLGGNENIKGNGFAHIKDLPLLRFIYVYDMNINDAGFAYLKEIPNLKSIDLQSVTLPENALEYFKEMTELDYLRLPSCKGMTDKDLAHLNNLKKLKFLELPPETTDQGLAYLKGFDSLETLIIVRTQVTDVGLAHLKNMAGLKLKSLTIHSQEISGSGLIHLKDMHQLQEIELGLDQMDDEGMKYLEGLTAVTVLYLTNNQISDAGLANIEGLTSLTGLSLVGTQITDSGMAYLKNLTSLKFLNLSGTKITDAGLTNIKGLTSLDNLHLDNTQITDAGLRNLKNLSLLNVLYLNSTNISDAGLINLKDLHCLRSLNLTKTSISGEGLIHLKDLKSLRTLYLYGNKINKEGFRHLKEMTGLSNLGLSEVPEDELENLDEALPDCEIYASSVKPAQPPSLFDKSLPDMKDFGINLSPSDVNDKSILVCFFDIQQRPSRNCIIQLSKRAEKLKAKDFLHDFKSIIKNDRLK